jgi:hypothetical protein
MVKGRWDDFCGAGMGREATVTTGCYNQHLKSMQPKAAVEEKRSGGERPQAAFTFSDK